jgi:hypothetical protein
MRAGRNCPGGRVKLPGCAMIDDTKQPKQHEPHQSRLTSKEGVALDIIFGLFGESRFNREFDDWGTYGKYLDVASRAPKLEAMHADVNRTYLRRSRSSSRNRQPTTQLPGCNPRRC